MNSSFDIDKLLFRTYTHHTVISNTGIYNIMYAISYTSNRQTLCSLNSLFSILIFFLFQSIDLFNQMIHLTMKYNNACNKLMQQKQNTIYFKNLKGQSCKLYNSKYMITSTQITNTKFFAFIAVPVFKLLSRKVSFMNRKDNKNC